MIPGQVFKVWLIWEIAKSKFMQVFQNLGLLLHISKLFYSTDYIFIAGVKKVQFSRAADVDTDSFRVNSIFVSSF